MSDLEIYDLYLAAFDDEKLARKMQTKALQLKVKAECDAAASQYQR